MAKISDAARVAANEVRAVNAEKRRKLANKLGVSVSALYPSNLANTSANNPTLLAAVNAGLPVAERKVAPKGKVITSVPLSAISDRPLPPPKSAAPKRAAVPEAVSMDTLARLIVAVARVLA